LEGKPPAAQIGNSKFKEVIIMASPLQFKIYNEERLPGFTAAFKSPWDAVIFCLSVSEKLTVKHQGRIVWKNRKADKRSDETFNGQVSREYDKLMKKVEANHADHKARYQRLRDKDHEQNYRNTDGHPHSTCKPGDVNFLTHQYCITKNNAR
jgi:hypothetical protein